MKWYKIPNFFLNVTLFLRININDSTIINELNLLRPAYSVKIISLFLFYQHREVYYKLNSPCGFSTVTVFHGL